MRCKTFLKITLFWFYMKVIFFLLSYFQKNDCCKFKNIHIFNNSKKESSFMLKTWMFSNLQQSCFWKYESKKFAKTVKAAKTAKTTKRLKMQKKLRIFCMKTTITKYLVTSFVYSKQIFVLLYQSLRGLVDKAPVWYAKGPGFESRSDLIFFSSFLLFYFMKIR